MKQSSCSLILLSALSLGFFTLQVHCKCQARINDEQRFWKEGMEEDSDNPIPYLKDPKYGPEYYWYWQRTPHIALINFFRKYPELKDVWKKYDPHYGWREKFTEMLEKEPQKYFYVKYRDAHQAHQDLKKRLKEESYAFRGKSGAKSPAKNSQGGGSSGENAASSDSTRNDQRPQENTARNDQSSRRDNSSSQQRSQNSQRDNTSSQQRSQNSRRNNASSQRDSNQQAGNNSDNQKSQNPSYEEQVAQRDQEYKESQKKYYKEAHEYYRKHNTPESVIKEYLKEHYVPPAGGASSSAEAAA